MLACPIARSAQIPLQFDVFLGYDGVVAQDAWTPLTCEIKNDSATFEGTVEVSPRTHGEVTQLRLELPKGTLKRVTIPVFSPRGSYMSWTVRLLDRKRKLIAVHEDVRPGHSVANGVPVLGSLSRTITGTPTIHRPAIQHGQSQQQPVAARILPQIFPDNPIVLEGLSAIYLNSERAADLKPAQSKALIQWLWQGGHLVVGLEQPQDLESSPWLRSIVPFRPKAVHGITNHSSLHGWITGPWPASRRAPVSPSRPGRSSGKRTESHTSAAPEMQPFKDVQVDSAFESAELRVITGELGGGDVLVAEGQTPLIVSSQTGLGQVTVLLFSPERDPLRWWKHLPIFWARLAQVPPEWYSSSDFNRYGMWTSDNVLGAMLETVQTRKLPLATLLLMLFGYILVIGPGDYFLVRRLKRPMLTWLTFPAYVAAFCAVIYMVGFRLRAGYVEWNELHVVDVFARDESNSFRGRSFGSLYSPANKTYNFKGPPGQAAFRSEQGGNYRSGDQAMFVSLQGETFRAEADVPVWTSQVFVSDWIADGQMPFTLRANGTSENFKLVCENRTGTRISVACVSSNTLWSAGEVASSAKQIFELRKQSGISLEAAKQNNAQRIRSAIQNRQMAFARSTNLERLNDWMFIVELLSFWSEAESTDYQTIYSNLDISSALKTRNEIVVFVSAPIRPPAGAMHDFKTNRGKQMTVWRVILPIENRPDGRL